VVKNGRYGPYVSHNGVNATLPKDVTPEQVTLAQAIELLNERSGKSGGKGGKKAKSGATGGATTGDAPRARRTTPRAKTPTAKQAAPAAAKKPKAAAKPAAAKKKKAAK
jgi:DNA topoisomerase-1